MQISEKVFLKWDDLQSNWGSSFSNFRRDEEFSDVTLASEDGTHVKCHKVILASSSPFFTETLKRVKHPHPLIYMKGVTAQELVAMVDFLYLGEATLNKDSLDAFLSLAEELRLRGLNKAPVNDNDPITETEPEFTLNSGKSLVAGLEDSLVEHLKPTHLPKEPELQNLFGSLAEMQDEIKSERDTDIDFTADGTRNDKVNTKAAQLKRRVNSRRFPVEPSHTVSSPMNVTDPNELDRQVKSMMKITEEKMLVGKYYLPQYVCEVCGKKGQMGNILMHIETNHITTNISHPCNICEKSSRFEF